MFYRNGSSESRAMVYDALYEGATADATFDDTRMCTDDIIGPLNPPTTWAGAELLALSGANTGKNVFTRCLRLPR